MAKGSNNWLLSMALAVGLCLSLGLVAAVVLAPPYARMIEHEHVLAKEEVRLAEARATLDAYGRLLEQAPTDEVLTQRLAWSQLGMYPSNETVLRNPNRKTTRPGVLAAISLPQPTKPHSQLYRMGMLLTNAARRRGLLAIAAILFVLCLILSAPEHHVKAAAVRVRTR
jgi:hypothetical protein